ncbi:MAG: GNAT family N-acetyltransferase [Candidatus Promineifilaceae bacterium]
MLAAPVLLPAAGRSGPRPINARRDVGQVFRLLDLAFGPRLAAGRWATGAGLSFKLEAPAGLGRRRPGRDIAPGFVWEEGGRVVANASLVEARLPGRFLVANVAVDPAYRRQGLGRALMEECLRHLQRRGAREVLLQVESDNEAGQRLYLGLGFVCLGNLGRWHTPADRLGSLPVPRTGLPDIRPLPAGAWRAALGLDTLSLRPELNWPVPPGKDKYGPGLVQRLDDFLNGRRRETWAVADLDGRQLAGLSSIFSLWGRPHLIELRVAPAWRGRLERPLLAKALRRLAYLRVGWLQISHPADDEITAALLREANFNLRRTLDVMRLTFSD